MPTYRLTIGSDGRVAIPDTQPGQTITIQLEPTAETPEPLTLATARTEDERESVKASIRANARALRELLKDEPPISTDELYGEDGLPR